MKPEEENMQPFFGAVLAIILTASASYAIAESQSDTDCDCTVSMGPPIVFTEDPLVFAGEGATFHAIVEEVYFDAGECVVFVNFPDGVTSTYPEVTGSGVYEVHRLKLAPHVAEHPAFAAYGDELTLSEVSTGASDVCSPVGLPTDEPTS